LIFETRGLEAITIDEKINKLNTYLSMYDKLNLPEIIETKKDTEEKEGQKPFRELDLDNLDINKLKLNLTK